MTIITQRNQPHIYVNLQVIDLHKTCEPTSSVVTQAIYGTAVKVLEQNGERSRYQTPDGYCGWGLSLQFITRFELYPLSTTTVRVNTLWTDLYPTQSITEKAPIISLSYATVIELDTAVDDRWIKVRLLDKKIGWAQKKDFLINPKTLQLNEMITEAKRFLGIPYKWGGKTPQGFDCSGFVQTLFTLAGINLPRDACQQAIDNRGKEIERFNLQQGDLLFFGSSRNAVNHVGIFLCNNEFIHAVATNEEGPHVVQISDLNTKEYSKKYLFGKRFSP